MLRISTSANIIWDRYPIQRFEHVEPIDPGELLRGSYVTLRIVDSHGLARRVRFLAAEQDALAIERAMWRDSVALEARVAPDGSIRPVAVITADGVRYETR